MSEREQRVEEIAQEYRQDPVWRPVLGQLFTLGLTVQILLVLWMRGWRRRKNRVNF